MLGLFYCSYASKNVMSSLWGFLIDFVFCSNIENAKNLRDKNENILVFGGRKVMTNI
mgnify:CR=1 FL=1